jgi:alcohol dehydrogenase class IV
MHERQDDDRFVGIEAVDIVAELAHPADRGLDGSSRRLSVSEEQLDACADAAADRAELDLIPARADRDELRALYAAAS